MGARPSLRERKRQRAREDVVAAAYALFAERGYAEVTVADIADRAEVGRTTFFRLFGDKQEVVFAGEQELLDELRARHAPARDADQAGGRAAPDLATAVELVRGIVLGLCAESVVDPDLYRLRERLITGNPELTDRGERKLARLVDLATEVLTGLGADRRTAVLAPWLARACFQAGRRLADGDPDRLRAEVAAAFDRLGPLRAPGGGADRAGGDLPGPRD